MFLGKCEIRLGVLGGQQWFLTLPLLPWLTEDFQENIAHHNASADLPSSHSDISSLGKHCKHFQWEQESAW